MPATRTLVLLLLAAAASAEEPILAPVGKTLAELTVAARADRIKCGSAKELATSYAQLRRDRLIVDRQWRRLFRAEHISVLEQHYAPALVQKQRDYYRKRDRGTDEEVKCVVESLKPFGRTTMHAKLAWTVRDSNSGRLVAEDLLLVMEKAGARWRVRVLRERGLRNGWRATARGRPALGELPEIPAAVKPDRSTAASTIASLERAMRRLALLGARSRRQFYLHQAEFVALLYGEPRAPRRAARPDTRVELTKPRVRIGDVMRIEAVLTEAVPETEERSARARVAFDLRPGSDGWRVVGELTRPRSDAPFEPAERRFAMRLSRMR